MGKILASLVVVTMAVFSAWATEGYDDLAKLVKSGMTEDVIIAYINSSKANFSLTPDNIVQLKTLGASDKVITAAIQHKKPEVPVVQNSAAAAPSKEDLTAAPQPAAPARDADPPAEYEAVPTSGGWVLVNNYWYWQYPTGVIVDLGWQPYYFYHHRWLPYDHWGHRGRW